MPKSKAYNDFAIFELSYDLRDADTNQALRAYFGNVVRGQDEVYTAPFAKGVPTKDLLSTWIKTLESIHDSWPSLYDFEIELASKVGPMSIRKPLDERLEDIRSYYDGILLPSKPLSSSAVAAVKKEFAPASGVGLRSQSKTVDLMKKSTNSGSPFFLKKRKVVTKTVPCAVKNRDGCVYQHLPAGYYQAVASLGWRGQEGGHSKDDTKQRVVWMFPFAVNVSELQFYQPAIESFQRERLVPAWVSMEAVDERVTKLFDTKGRDDLIVCTDFSKFDQHFNHDLQEAAFKTIAFLIGGEQSAREWLTETFPIKYMIPLAYDWGKVRTGRHGMGSGSGGTNFDETMAHRALQYEAAQIARSRLNPNSQCLGDDGILSYPGITVEDVVKAYTSHGLEMNLDKQYASTQDCTYLRRWHHKDYRSGGVCVGVYSTCRAIGRLRYLERRMDPKKGWDEKAVALRQLSIIENCKWHPLRIQFLEFCMKRDKYRLGLDIPGFMDNLRQIAMDKIDYMPDFLGYTKTLQSKGDPVGGIEQWWVVKALKSYR